MAGEPGTAELLIYGEIADTSWYGDEVTPKQFADDLKALGAVTKLRVKINSGGGDPWAAQAIGDMIEHCGAETTAYIQAVCASAATVIACHCSRVVAAEGSTYMIHPVKVGLNDYKTADELRACVAMLDVLKENIVNLYVKKTGKSKDEVAGWMDATSWWTAEQAMENGFVDEVQDGGEKPTVENRSGILFMNAIDTGLPFDAAPKFVQDSLMAVPAAGRVVNTAPAGEPEQTDHEEVNTMPNEIKNLEELRAAYPDLVNQAEAAVRTEAEGTVQNAERARLRAIDEVADMMPPELVNEAKYGEKACNAQELAYRAAMDAKQHGRAFLSALANDAADSGAGEVKPVAPPDVQDKTKLTDAERKTKAENLVHGLLHKEGK